MATVTSFITEPLVHARFQVVYKQLEEYKEKRNEGYFVFILRNTN